MTEEVLRVHDILLAVQADGLLLRADGGRLVIVGDEEVIARWRPMLAGSKYEILAALAEPLNRGDIASAEATAATPGADPTAARWRLHFYDREAIEMTTAPPAARAEVLALYPNSMAVERLAEPDDPAPACSTCKHISVFSNCARPMDAGIAMKFELVKHPTGGAGCIAFELTPMDIDARLAQLVAEGAIDGKDADQCRRRYPTDPAAWDVLLDACEACAKAMKR